MIKIFVRNKFHRLYVYATMVTMAVYFLAIKIALATSHGFTTPVSSGGFRSPVSSGSGRLQNPLEFNSIAEFVAAALQALVVIALPIVGFFILLSGFLFISAQGNQEKLIKAKTNFMWVIAGAILILGAWALSQLIGGTIEQLRA